MKRLHIVMVVVFAMFVFGAVLVSSASAEVTLLASWLVGGVAIAATLNVEASGSVLAEDTKTIAGAAAILCTGTVIGTIKSNGEGEITGIFNLAKEAVGALGGLALLGTSATGPDCVTETLCAAGTEASPIEVWPHGLPWLSLLYLMENGEILNLIVADGPGLEVGYELLCLVLGLNTEDLCSSPKVDVLILNDPVTGDAETPAGTRITPNFLCTQSNEESTVTETDELVTVTLVGSTELLTVSSE